MEKKFSVLEEHKLLLEKWFGLCTCFVNPLFQSSWHFGCCHLVVFGITVQTFLKTGKVSASLLRMRFPPVVATFLSQIAMASELFDCKVRFDVNTEGIVKRRQIRIYRLRNLNSFKVCCRTLSHLYYSFVQNLI